MFSYIIYAIKFVYDFAEKKNGNLIFYFTLRIEKNLVPRRPQIEYRRI